MFVVIRNCHREVAVHTVRVLGPGIVEILVHWDRLHCSKQANAASAATTEAHSPDLIWRQWGTAHNAHAWSSPRHLSLRKQATVCRCSRQIKQGHTPRILFQPRGHCCFHAIPLEGTRGHSVLAPQNMTNERGKRSPTGVRGEGGSQAASINHRGYGYPTDHCGNHV